jgi:hypothetical protein
MSTAEIRLYEMLKAKIGEREAEAFMELAERTVDQRFEYAKSELASKKDMADLRVDMADLRVDMADLRVETKNDIANLKVELTKRMAQFTVGQFLAIVASVVSLMLLLRK